LTIAITFHRESVPKGLTDKLKFALERAEGLGLSPVE
jgi:hypothetical protein